MGKVAAAWVVVLLALAAGCETKDRAPPPAPAADAATIAIAPSVAAPDASPDASPAPLADAAPVDPEALARQQRLDEARKAGVLGEISDPGGGFADITGKDDFPDRGPGSGPGEAAGPRAWPEQKARPRVGIGKPEVSAGLDAAVVRRTLIQRTGQLTYCYEKQLLVSPALQGRMKLTWTILPTGLVKEARASGLDDRKLEGCLEGMLLRFTFPRPKHGKIVLVSVPVVLTNPDAAK